MIAARPSRPRKSKLLSSTRPGTKARRAAGVVGEDSNQPPPKEHKACCGFMGHVWSIQVAFLLLTPARPLSLLVYGSRFPPTPTFLVVDSLSILFSHRSFQKPDRHFPQGFWWFSRKIRIPGLRMEMEVTPGMLLWHPIFPFLATTSMELGPGSHPLE